MPDITLLLTGAQALARLMREARPLVEDIRSDKRARNEDTKNELSHQLDEVEAALGQVRALAQAATDYGESLDEVRRLLWLCERAQIALREPTRGARREFTSLWQTIDNQSDVIRRAALGLDQWYDKHDEGSMQAILKNLADARTGVGNFIRLEAMSEVARKLDEMVTQLKDMETLLSSTLYDKILHTLQNLGKD